MHPATRAISTAYAYRPKVSLGSQLTTALLATGAGIGVFWGIRSVVKNFKKGIRENEALIEGNPATYATQLKLAFENNNYFGWGTDEEVVFATLDSIPTQSIFRKVQRAYRDLYGRNLAADLKEELDTEEYAIAIEIINAKP
ncbi:MAG: hypothetical protein AAGA02_00125 [Bacteroidota bacterium]